MSTTLYRDGIVDAPANPGSTALLIEDGRISWIGTEDQAAGVAELVDSEVRLHGALVTAGFVDAHTHLLDIGLRARSLDLGGATCLADLFALVHDAASGEVGHRLAAEGAPLIGHDWDELDWPERRPPTATELNDCAGCAPVYLARADRRCAVVSSSFAQVLGLHRYAGWSDTGLITGEAFQAARDGLPDPPRGLRDEIYRSVLAAAAQAGVVAVHEHSHPGADTREGVATLLALTANPDSGLPLVVGYRAELCETTDDVRALQSAIPGLTGVGGDLAVDGTIGARTAALSRPYADAQATAASLTGQLELTAEQVSSHVASTTRAGVQAGFHVVGDRALAEVLLGMRAAADVEGVAAIRRMRHRLEHMNLVDAPALATSVLLGVTASVQPSADALWGNPGGMYETRLGRSGVEGVLPLADLQDSGVPLAFGSNGAAGGGTPWETVRAAVLHHSPVQRLSVRDAFSAHTRGGWQAGGASGSVGELRVGAPAHLAVWRVHPDSWRHRDRTPSLSSRRPGVPALDSVLPDPTTQAPLPECIRTVRGGVVVFDAMG